ncbi:hypothetical protein [Acidianus ambivalens]|uniref:hypothetical protein n=1 Tax=Acidianus ambivalens TaxID=2283 RepID=UPI001E53CF14|nr:hypothetical protein [Acidianus ambivalens]
MEFLSLLAKVKPNKRNLSIIFLSIILVGIGLWLFHIDHNTYIYEPALTGYNVTRIYSNGTTTTIPVCKTLALGPVVITKVIPPPWYASLWPVFLVNGIGLIGFSVIIQIVRRNK